MDPKGRFSVDAPQGWQYATAALGADFTASKKSARVLQQIWIEHLDLEKAFLHTHQLLSADAEPAELSKALVIDFQADRAHDDFELMENGPATIGGVRGCRVTFSYQTPERLRLVQRVYACARRGELWLFRYRAPTGFFEQDEATFDSLVKSFRFAEQ